MMFKAAIASTILIAGLLVFSHPTPFRVPEYLEKRNRPVEIIDSTWKREAIGLFSSDTSTDIARVHSVTIGTTPGVEIRFNHGIPSITLADKYDRITFIQTVDDIDGDGYNELYFIAAEHNSCRATGILAQLREKKWIELQSVNQYGCILVESYTRMVRTSNTNEYTITYQPTADSDQETIKGKL